MAPPGAGSADLGAVLNSLPAAPAAQTNAVPASASTGEDQFISFVVDKIQTFWSTELTKAGRNYQRTVLVLFSGSTSTGCGGATSQTGPFYCPADRKVYLDLGFFQELQRRTARLATSPRPM